MPQVDGDGDHVTQPESLEEQNAALCKTQIALQLALDRYTHLYELAPVGYLTLNETGLIEEINFTGAELLGLGRERLLHLSFAKFVARSDVERWQSCLRSVLEQDDKLDCELAFNRADGHFLFVRLDCLRLKRDGDPTIVRVTLTDITERKRAEQRTAIVFRTSPIAIGIARVSDGRLVEVNEAMGRHFGWKRDEVLGKTSVEIGYWPSVEARQQWLKLLRVDGELYGYEVEICDANGERRNVLMSSSFIEFAGESCVVSFLPDITERKRTAAYEKYCRHILDLLASAAPIGSVLEEIVKGIEQVNTKMLCSILLLDQAGTHLHIGAAPSLPAFYNAAIEGIEIGVGVGSCGTAAFTGKRVIVEDIQTHPYWHPYKELAAKAGLGACWSQPIFSAKGAVIGTFAIYHREMHTPAEYDIYIIEQSAHLASIAIERY